MKADNEMSVLQESLAPIQDSAAADIDTELHTDEDNMQNPVSYEVWKGVERKVIKVFGDGRFMFCSVAAYLEQAIQKCKRSDCGWPMLQENSTKERSSVDNLRKATVQKIAEMLSMYKEKNEVMGYPKHFDSVFGNIQERLKEMKNSSIYAGESELRVLPYVVEHPIHVFQPSAKYCYGEVFQEKAAPIHLKYTAEAISADGKRIPAHYDLLIDPLYPRTGDFVGTKFGRSTWYMAQVADIDHSVPEIKVKFMTKSGNTYIFTDEQPSWVDLEKMMHICDTPDIDHRFRYIFAKKDIDIIESKLK